MTSYIPLSPVELFNAVQKGSQSVSYHAKVSKSKADAELKASGTEWLILIVLKAQNKTR